jgi:hypothetical protein
MASDLTVDQLHLLWRLLANAELSRSTEASLKKADPGLNAIERAFEVDRGAYATAVRTIADQIEKGVTQSDITILALFRYAGLNLKNPRDWQIALRSFCEHVFEKPREKTSTWNDLDDGAKNDLLRHVEEIKTKRPELRKPRKDTQIAKELQKLDEYEKYGDLRSITRLMREAADPKSNLSLRYPDMPDPILRSIRSDLEDKGIAWTPEIAAEQQKLLRQVQEAYGEAQQKLGVPKK